MQTRASQREVRFNSLREKPRDLPLTSLTYYYPFGVEVIMQAFGIPTQKGRERYIQEETFKLSFGIGSVWTIIFDTGFIQLGPLWIRNRYSEGV